MLPDIHNAAEIKENNILLTALVDKTFFKLHKKKFCTNVTVLILKVLKYAKNYSTVRWFKYKIHPNSNLNPLLPVLLFLNFIHVFLNYFILKKNLHSYITFWLKYFIL